MSTRPAWIFMARRLLKDSSGNMLPLAAAAIFPLVGVIGGGLDMSRIYIVKSRLQHACDAGALAGRRTMGGGTWAQGSGEPNRQAEQFFFGNMAPGTYGAQNLRVAYSESAGTVRGTASAAVPMTLMSILGATSRNVSVTCEAEMRLPNTDVMFVLDVTGSMASAIPGDSQTRIEGLRTAVKCFYELLAKRDTNADCEGGRPSGGVTSETQVRFGFVPYASNVNVGRLLPSSYVRNSWTYQSRRPTFIHGTFSAWDGTSARNASAWSGYSDTGQSAVVANQSACNDTTMPVPAIETTLRPNATGLNGDSETAAQFRAWLQASQRQYQRVYVGSTRVCKIQVRTRNLEHRAWLNRASESASGAIATPAWRYEPVEIDLRPLKNGSGWNTGLDTQLGYGGASLRVNWDGCIEERQTARASVYVPVPEDAFDLNIDMAPRSSEPDTQWAPALASLAFVRRADANNGSQYSLAPITTFTNYSGHSYSCPVAARKLQEWNSASDFTNYVDSLQPNGNTYHDIGVLWGARLMSPTGIFSNENNATPQGGEIQRHMLFMTDGEACTSALNYQTYGLAWFDRRQTSPGTPPTDGCATTGSLTQQVNARTAALCQSVRNMNITLWVVWFGESNSTIENQLRSCATPGRFYLARNSADLQRAFRAIAGQISQLRVTG